MSSGLRLGWLTSFLLATVFLPSSLCASGLGDTARQLAHKIAAAAGPGAFALEVTNRSSLDDKSVREVRSALETQLHVEGVQHRQSRASDGNSRGRSLREPARIRLDGRDYDRLRREEGRHGLVAATANRNRTPFTPALPIILKTTLLFAQEQPMLDVALVEMPGGSRLLVLNDGTVAIYRQRGANPAGRWELETSLPIAHSRTFPRDLRGRLLLRRDHLFDVYLPGTFCRSTSSADCVAYAEPATTADDPWPLTSRRRQRARLLCGLAQFLHRSALSRNRKDLQRSFVLFGGRASAIELHAMGASLQSMDRCILSMG